jgi:hypothetical protein
MKTSRLFLPVINLVMLLLASMAVQSAPLAAHYYSAQNPDQPPLPFNPFPEAPVVDFGNGRFVFDDTEVDYGELLLMNSMNSSAPPVPGGGGGGGSGSQITWPPPTASLRLDSRGALLSWNSMAGSAYRIDFAPNLHVDTEDWFTLVDGYTSHGTNTFWKDTGYWQFVSKPGADTMRFYRIMEISNAPARPTVTISVASGTLSDLQAIGVTVTPQGSILGATLWVDGEFVDEIDGTSDEFVLDTATFANGQHTIFVTAAMQSGAESTDIHTNSNIGIGYGVSQFVTRTFQNSPASQASSAARPPVSVTNTFGVIFQGTHPSWAQLGPNVNWAGPDNGLGSAVILNGDVQNPDGLQIPRPYGPIRSAIKIADGFVVGLGRVGHRPRFFLGDRDVARSNYIRKPFFGGYSKFNEVNIGLLIGHGARGLTFDYTTGLPGIKDTYTPIWAPRTAFYDWVRLSECDFGSANLRWMAILTCNNLHEINYQDMWEKFRLPVNEQLHLLLGCSTTVYMVSSFGRIFGDQLSRGTSVREAWFHAGRATQHVNNPHPTEPVRFRVVGWLSCWNDTIYNWSEPEPEEGFPFDEERQVFP